MKIQFFKNICLSMAFIFIMGVSGNLLGASKVMAAEGAEAKENPAFLKPASVSQPEKMFIFTKITAILRVAMGCLIAPLTPGVAPMKFWEANPIYQWGTAGIGGERIVIAKPTPLGQHQN